MYRCSLPSCQFFSFTPKGLQKHCEAKHNQKATIKLCCSVCSTVISPRSKLFGHELNAHSLDIPSMAPKIKKNDLPNGWKTDDYIVKKAVTKFPCDAGDNCQYVALRSDYLSTHMQDVHKIRVRIIYECDKCHFQSLDANDFRAHSRNCPVWHNEDREEEFISTSRNQTLLREAIEMVGSFSGNIAHYFRLKQLYVSPGSIQTFLASDTAFETVECETKQLPSRKKNSEVVKVSKKEVTSESNAETSLPTENNQHIDKLVNIDKNAAEKQNNKVLRSNQDIYIAEFQPITTTTIEAISEDNIDETTFRDQESVENPTCINKQDQTQSNSQSISQQVQHLLNECRDQHPFQEDEQPPEDKRQLRAVYFKQINDRKTFNEKLSKLCNQYMVKPEDLWPEVELKESKFREELYELVTSWNNERRVTSTHQTEEGVITRNNEEYEDIQCRLASRNLTRRERFDLLRRRKNLRQDKNAAFIRRKFNYRSKQVFEEIIAQQTQPRCNIQIDDIYKIYHQRYAETEEIVTPVPFDGKSSSFRDIELSDVVSAIRKCNPRTSAGYDGITNRIWKSSPAFAEYLTALFQRCFIDARIPKSWKVSKTILLYKKGDVNEISSWRPINLQITIAKLYTSVLNTLTREVSTSNGLISKSQKGFMNFNGCAEHDFVAQAMTRNARRTKSDLFICAYDFKDAFGSIDLKLIQSSLLEKGFDSISTNIIMSNYVGSGFWIKTKENSKIIRQRRGLKQGDPLSPIIFNLVIDNLSSKLSEMPKTSLGLNHMLFADDLVIAAETRQHLIAMHEETVKWCSASNIQINVKKCRLFANLHAGGSHRKDDELTILNVGSERIPQVKSLSCIEYLGNVVGLVKSNKYNSFKELLQETKSLLTNTAKSPLHTHQKHYVIRNMILPKWEHYIRLNGIGISHSKKLGEEIRRAVRSYCKFPAFLSLPFYHFNTENGGLNIQEPWVWSCSTQCIHIVSLLNSNDEVVKKIARHEITTLIKLRYDQNLSKGGTVDDEAIAKYLNGEYEQFKKRRTIDCMDPMAHAPRSTRSVYCKFVVENGKFILLKESETGELLDEARSVKDVKEHVMNIHADQWFASKKPQSKKTVSCRNIVSNSWINTNELSAKNYNFCVKARADVLPTRKNLFFWKKANSPNCSTCNQPEDISHVLSFCRHGMGLRRELHDKILQRLGRTSNYNNRQDHQEVRINQSIEGLQNDCLRPDLVIVDNEKKTATIVDLAITNQSSSSSLEDARQKKIAKYLHIKDFYEEKGYSTSLNAIVFGNLGATDEQNVNLMRSIGSTIGYIRRMHRYIINDIMRFAYRQWVNRSQR